MYPSLYKVLLEMATCNQMNLVPQKDWYQKTKGFGYNLLDLDKQASLILQQDYEKYLIFVDGERRCSCGNNRYYLEVDGDFIKGFYSYGQWC